MSTYRRWIIVIALATGACGGSAPSPDAGPDAEPDADPYCHYDCLGYHECADGVVTTFASYPVPCEYWEGSCPIEDTLACEQGCRDDITMLELSEDPSLLCEENRPQTSTPPHDDKMRP